MSLSFGEKVSKLEEAAVDLLFDGMPYVRVVSTYNGELGDRPKLIEALKTLSRDFPLVLLGYPPLGRRRRTLPPRLRRAHRHDPERPVEPG